MGLILWAGRRGTQDRDGLVPLRRCVREPGRPEEAGRYQGGSWGPSGWDWLENRALQGWHFWLGPKCRAFSGWLLCSPSRWQCVYENQSSNFGDHQLNILQEREQGEDGSPSC